MVHGKTGLELYHLAHQIQQSGQTLSLQRIDDPHAQLVQPLDHSDVQILRTGILFQHLSQQLDREILDVVRLVRGVSDHLLQVVDHHRNVFWVVCVRLRQCPRNLQFAQRVVLLILELGKEAHPVLVRDPQQRLDVRIL